MPFSRHTRRSVFSIGAASLAAAFLFLTPENTHAADTTAKIHILTLDSGSNAIVLESVDDNGQKIFGMVDSGEDWDYPDGSDPRYPLRSGITTSTGYDDEVLSYLDSLGVTSDNLQFYVATHPHSDHIGTGDTIVRLYSPDRVYLLPYDDSYIYNTARLWDNLYVYDQLLTAVEETEGVTLIQHLNPGAASAEEGSPDFAFGNFQIQIVNYEEDYLTSPKEDANQFCLGVIASANDCAVALAEFLCGSEEAFVTQMNTRAKELGMENTNFENTNGLDDTVTNHKISARDIAIMSRELLSHELILKYSSTWMDTIRDGTFGLTNTNRLVRFYSGANGLKTGSTSRAKFCISATAKRDGMQLIAVIMAAPTRDIRNNEAKQLLDFGFANYGVYTAEAGTLEPIRVQGGVSDFCPLTYAGYSAVLEKGDISKITKRIELPESARSPISKGDALGSVIYECDGKELGRVDILAAEAVDAIGFGTLFLRLLKGFCLS